MASTIDLSYRPATYFRPQKLERYLLSQMKGRVIRQRAKELFAQGRHGELASLIGTRGISKEDNGVLERFHPMFMGGNYLPDTEEGEVEIACIRIASTTHDVTSVYARMEEGEIVYRVVDEYGGDTLQGPAECRSREPLTQGALAEFFLKAWPLLEVLEMNFEGDLEASLRFFSCDSEFYPDLDALCRERVRARFPESADTQSNEP
jgi:hypothetical protein